MFFKTHFILRRRVAIKTADFSHFNREQRERLEGLRKATLLSLLSKYLKYAEYGDKALNKSDTIDLGPNDPVVNFYKTEARSFQQEQLRTAIVLYNKIAPEVNVIVFGKNLWVGVMDNKPEMPKTRFRQLQLFVIGLREVYSQRDTVSIYGEQKTLKITSTISHLYEELVQITKQRKQLHPEPEKRHEVDEILFWVAHSVQMAQPVIDLIRNNPDQLGLDVSLEPINGIESALSVLNRVNLVIFTEAFKDNYSIEDSLGFLFRLSRQFKKLDNYHKRYAAIVGDISPNMSVLNRYASWVLRHWNELQYMTDLCDRSSEAPLERFRQLQVSRLAEEVQDRQTLLHEFRKLTQMAEAGAIPIPDWNAPDNCLEDQYDTLCSYMQSLPEVDP